MCVTILICHFLNLEFFSLRSRNQTIYNDTVYLLVQQWKRRNISVFLTKLSFLAYMHFIVKSVHFSWIFVNSLKHESYTVDHKKVFSFFMYKMFMVFLVYRSFELIYDNFFYKAFIKSGSLRNPRNCADLIKSLNYM